MILKMSTEIYGEEPKLVDTRGVHLKWLIDEIIRPQLPEIRENLENCVKTIDEHDLTEYKLPISSYNSEEIKGTVTRQNFKIIDLKLDVKMSKFNNGKLVKFQLNKPVLIRQLLDCNDCIDNCISGLNKLIDNEALEPNLFIKYFEQVINGIKLGIKNLNEPNEGYTFPKLRIPNENMTPKLPNEISIDLNLSNNEISIDVYILKVITTEPWSLIINKRRGISFIDSIRGRISRERTKPVNSIIQEEYNKLDPNTGLLSNFFGSNLTNVLQTFDQYINKCLTIEDSENRGPIVVKIDEMKSVVTNDPMILSISIKLSSLEKAMVGMMDNLRLD